MIEKVYADGLMCFFLSGFFSVQAEPIFFRLEDIIFFVGVICAFCS